MKLRYPFLQWMWSAHVTDALDRDDMLSINANQRKQTRIHGYMLNFLLSTL
jgi:hypothetical protein